jgi:hypothetical protein
MMIWKSKKIRRMAVVAFIPSIVVFWFVTAPAGMALQRIASAGNGGPVARVICAVTDWYESPLVYVNRIPALRRMSDSLQDHWCELLGAPETTP